MRTSLSIALTGLGSLLTMACSATVGAQNELDADTAGPVHAVVVVERAQQGEGARVNAIARFVTVRGGAVDDRALRTVGALAEIPQIGACAVVDDAAEAAVRGVDLRDVGTVSLEVAGAKSALVPRQIPDPVGRVTGVFYYAPTDVQGVTPGTKLLLRVGGTADIAAFSVTAAAPRDLGDVRAAGQDMQRPIVLAPGAPVELAWDGPDDGAALFVDVSVAGRQTTRCTFADVGRGVVPASALNGDAGQITVHRVKRERFAARGVEPGELRLDFSRTTSYTRR